MKLEQLGLPEPEIDYGHELLADPMDESSTSPERANEKDDDEEEEDKEEAGDDATADPMEDDPEATEAPEKPGKEDDTQSSLNGDAFKGAPEGLQGEELRHWRCDRIVNRCNLQETINGLVQTENKKKLARLQSQMNAARQGRDLANMVRLQNAKVEVDLGMTIKVGSLKKAKSAALSGRPYYKTEHACTDLPYSALVEFFL